MVIVTDMSTGKIEKSESTEAETVAEEFGAFVDEVVNAGWVPQPEARLVPCVEHADKSAVDPAHAEEFLRTHYRSQE